MFQTATVTDLRFNTKEVLEKCKNLIWIFHHGKRVALIIDAANADALLQKASVASEFPTTKLIAPSILNNIKKFLVKGPKDLSKTIDTTIYG